MLAVGAAAQREDVLESIRLTWPDVCGPTIELSAMPLNGATERNVQGLCDLIDRHGEAAVRDAVVQVDKLSPRNLRCRIPYVAALLKHRHS